MTAVVGSYLPVFEAPQLSQNQLNIVIKGCVKITCNVPYNLPGLDERSIMHSVSSSCSTDSMNIMSKSLTIAPFITIISSPFMRPKERPMDSKSKITVM